MADKSFGVTQLDILGSGEPTISAPDRLKLDSHNVAISTSLHVGAATTIGGDLNVSGVSTFSAGGFVDIRRNVSITGIATIAAPYNTNAQVAWTVTNNSASAYRFTGPGQSGSDDNPDLYLVRGQRYIFKHEATSSHPLEIRVANGGAAYNDGVTNNGQHSTNITFNVQHDAPAQLFYQCTSHGGMVGNIYIVGGPQVISGVVTATTFVGNLTGTASANAVLTGSTNNTVCTVTGANAIQGESNLSFDGTNLKVGNTATLSNYNQTDILLGDHTGHSGMTILSSPSHGGFIMFSDNNGGGTNAYRGQIEYAHSSDYMRFITDSAERLRITSTGNLLLGTSTAAIGGGRGLMIADAAGARIKLCDSDQGVTANDGFEIIAGNGGTGYINNKENQSIVISTNNTERMRVTHEGSVGIGTDNPSYELEVHDGTGAAALRMKDGANNVVCDLIANSTGGLLRTTYNHPLVFHTNQVERVRITNTGRFGIGTASPGHKFTVTDASSSIGFSRSGNNPQIIFDANNVGAAAMFQVSESSGGAYLQMYTKDTSGNLDECIRVDPNQRVMMGSISSPPNSSVLTLRGETTHLTCQSIHTGGYYSIYFRSANTNVGNIYFNSGGTQFNTSSDYRRKENVVSLTGAIDRVKTLLPKRFNFISEPSVIRDGFLAHEVTAVPEAITGVKDAVEPNDDDERGVKKGDPIYQCIDQSKLVPLLTASIQELITKVETLEQDNIALRVRVTNLEGN